MYKLKPTQLNFQFDLTEHFERNRDIERNLQINMANRSFNNGSNIKFTNTTSDLNKDMFTSPPRTNYLINKSFNAQLQTRLQSTNKKASQLNNKPPTNEVDYYDEIDYDNEQIISHPEYIQTNSKPKLASATLGSLSSSKLKKFSNKVNACLKLSTKTVFSSNSSKVNPPMPPKQPPPCKQHRRRSCSSSTHSSKLNTSTTSTNSSVSFRSFSRSNCNSPVFFRKTSSSSSFNTNTRTNSQEESRTQQMNSTILSFYSLNDSSMPTGPKWNKSKNTSNSNKSSSDSGISSSRDDSSFISSSLSSSSIPSSRRSSPSFLHQQPPNRQSQQFQPIENAYHTLIDMKHSPFPQVKTCFVAQIKQATPKPAKLLPKVHSPFAQKRYSINDVLGSIKSLGLDHQDLDDAICDEEVEFYLSNYEQQQQQQLNNSQQVVYRTLWEHLV